MIERRPEVPFTNFLPEQALAFQFRWDKLQCLLLQRNVLADRCDTIKREITRADHLLSRRIYKVKLIVAVFALIIVLRNVINGDVWYAGDTESFSIFLSAVMIALLLILIFSLDAPARFEGELKVLELELEKLSSEFRATSGGVGWSTYISEDPLGFASPVGDPHYMALKISIAERCLWNGDFQMDQDVRKVMWVRG